MPIHYSDKVDYNTLDRFAEKAILKFSQTKSKSLVRSSLGETAQVFDLGPFYIAINAEILGTKVMVATAMSFIDSDNKAKYFKGIGQDTANMSLNDLAAVGAQPFSYNPIITMGDDKLIRDEDVVDALLEGYFKAVNEAGAVIPGGETGVIEDIINHNELDLAGSSVGIISPKSRYCHGDKVEPGDHLYGLTTISPHANGFTAIREIARTLPQVYFNKLPSGRTYGEAVLEPTPGYSGIVNALLDQVEIHYFQPITGHGFEKIKRPKRNLTYNIIAMPEFPEIFQHIQEHAEIDDKEMLKTYNCGIGFVIYAPANKEIIRIAGECGFNAIDMGIVEEGPRQVIVEPFDVII